MSKIIPSNNEADDMSEYERNRYSHMQRNFNILKSTGLTPKIPTFMRNKKIKDVNRIQEEINKGVECKMPKATKEETDKKIVMWKSINSAEKTQKAKFPVFKNVKLKLFGQEDRSLVTKDSLPKGSELQKFVDMVKGPSTSKQLSKKKKSLNLTCGKQWIGKFLKFAEKHLETLDQQTLSIQFIYECERKDQIMDSEPKRRYPRRNIEKKSYKEEDISSEDEFLYCDECGREYKGVCPVHGPMLWVCDRKVRKDTPNKADGTLPIFLSIGRSAIPKAGLGIWTEIPLPQGMVFGPYKGSFTRNRKEARKSGYAWQVWKGNRAHHFIQGEDKGVANWLRFVNCADREERQSMMAFQYKKQVYYKTYKAVLPFTELLVWYGDDFAQDLGINIQREKNLPHPAEIEGFECNVCNGLFSTRGALERHQKRHPHMESDRRHKCHECPYSTDYTSNLRRHLLTHSVERLQACQHCHKAFKSFGHFQRHLFTHTGEKPFSCNACGRAFNRLSTLRTHERVHSGETPYRCPTCGKDFKITYNLQRHERTHTQQKPYKCPHCDYRTGNPSNLKVHTVFKHTRDFSHVCSICSKGFIAPSTLRTHIAEAHAAVTISG